MKFLFIIILYLIIMSESDRLTRRHSGSDYKSLSMSDDESDDIITDCEDNEESCFEFIYRIIQNIIQNVINSCKIRVGGIFTQICKLMKNSYIHMRSPPPPSPPPPQPQYAIIQIEVHEDPYEGIMYIVSKFGKTRDNMNQLYVLFDRINMLLIKLMYFKSGTQEEYNEIWVNINNVKNDLIEFINNVENQLIESIEEEQQNHTINQEIYQKQIEIRDSFLVHKNKINVDLQDYTDDNFDEVIKKKGIWLERKEMANSYKGMRMRHDHNIHTPQSIEAGNSHLITFLLSILV